MAIFILGWCFKFLIKQNKGDKVITIGGLHGKIIEIDEEAQTIDLEVANNVRLKFEKSSISLENTKAIDSKK